MRVNMYFTIFAMIVTSIALLLNGCGDQPAENSEPTVKPAWASAMGKDKYGTWADLSVSGVTQRFRWICAGTFTMGSPIDEKERMADETPHKVTLTHSFWLGDSSCTQGLWKYVMRSNPSRFTGNPLLPVEQVSWDDCQVFISNLNSLMPTVRARLPTEAEWEYACRAGTTGPFSGGSLEDISWCVPNARMVTHPVKLKLPNAWGIYDMQGNVDNWCADWYDLFSSDDEIDPKGPPKGWVKAVRGGSYFKSSTFCRVARRNIIKQDMNESDLGFRLCISAQPDKSP